MMMREDEMKSHPAESRKVNAGIAERVLRCGNG